MSPIATSNAPTISGAQVPIRAASYALRDQPAQAQKRPLSTQFNRGLWSKMITTGNAAMSKTGPIMLGIPAFQATSRLYYSTEIRKRAVAATPTVADAYTGRRSPLAARARMEGLAN